MEAGSVLNYTTGARSLFIFTRSRIDREPSHYPRPWFLIDFQFSIKGNAAVLFYVKVTKSLFHTWLITSTFESSQNAAENIRRGYRQVYSCRYGLWAAMFIELKLNHRCHFVIKLNKLNLMVECYFIFRRHRAGKRKTKVSSPRLNSCKHIVPPVILPPPPFCLLKACLCLFGGLCASSSLWQTKWKSITLISGLVLFSRLIGTL